MGRLIAVVAFILVMAAPTSLAQQRHEDFSRSSDDYAVLRLTADLVLKRSTDALNASLALDHAAALRIVENASKASQSMEHAAATNATAATSTARLGPLASAAWNLSGNASTLVGDWQAFQIINERDQKAAVDVARANLLIGSMRASIAAGFEVATRYEALDFDVRWLRAALDAFLEELIPLEPPETADPVLFLEVAQSDVHLTRPLRLRGLLLAPSNADQVIALNVDGNPWGMVTTDSDGFFQLDQAVPRDTPLGAHGAEAAVAQEGGLVSNVAAFNVSRIPTLLEFTVSPARVAQNATIALHVRLTDDIGSPLPAGTTVLIGGTDLEKAALSLDAGGRGRLSVNTTGLALGFHQVVVSYLGDNLYSPSEARLPTEVVPNDEFERAENEVSQPTALFLLLLLPIGLHALGLHILRKRPFLFHVLACSVPFAIAAATLTLRAGSPIVFAGFVLSGLVSVVFVWHHRRTRSHSIPARFPTRARQRAPTVNAGVAPGIEAALFATTGGTGPFAELVDLYRGVLLSLVRQGVAIGPLTHREIARVLNQRACPEGPVHALTQAVEAALYGGRTPTAEEMPALRQAVAALGVTP